MSTRQPGGLCQQVLTFAWLPVYETGGGSNPCQRRGREEDHKSAGSRKAGLAMAYRLPLAAEKRWPKANAPHLMALVKASVKFPTARPRCFSQRNLMIVCCSLTLHRCSPPMRFESTTIDDTSTLDYTTSV